MKGGAICSAVAAAAPWMSMRRVEVRRVITASGNGNQ
jgi:hypothetical protein